MVTDWNNGSHSSTGAGYGFKVSVADRDSNFSKEWGFITIVFPDGTDTKVNVGKSSFWDDTCTELISKDIGLWLLVSEHAPWPKGKPPKFTLQGLSSAKFVVSEGAG